MILENLACPRVVITYIAIIRQQFNTFDCSLSYPLKINKNLNNGI